MVTANTSTVLALAIYRKLHQLNICFLTIAKGSQEPQELRAAGSRKQHIP